MNERPECREFQALFDELGKPDTPPDIMARLHEHASGCTSCRAILMLRESLLRPGLGELEQGVPEEIVEELYEGVEDELNASYRSGHSRVASERIARWLLPAMAAALLLLLAGGSYLGVEIRRLRTNEASLKTALADQDRRLAGLARDTLTLDRYVRGDGERVQAALGGSGKEVSLLALRRAIANLPSEQRLLDRRQLEALDLNLPWIRAFVDNQVLGPRELADGLQAGELLAILNDPELDPGLSLPRPALERLIRQIGRSDDL